MILHDLKCPFQLAIFQIHAVAGGTSVHQQTFGAQPEIPRQISPPTNATNARMPPTMPTVRPNL